MEHNIIPSPMMASVIMLLIVLLPIILNRLLWTLIQKKRLSKTSENSSSTPRFKPGTKVIAQEGDLAGVICYISRTTESNLGNGYYLEDVNGRHIWSLYPEDKLIEFPENLANRFKEILLS